MKKTPLLAVVATLLLAGACINYPKDVDTNPAVGSEKRDVEPFSHEIRENSGRMFREGRQIFRHDTFGSEAFWGGQLRLHQAIAGSAHGGVGPGLTAHDALR